MHMLALNPSPLIPLPVPSPPIFYSGEILPDSLQAESHCLLITEDFCYKEIPYVAAPTLKQCFAMCLLETRERSLQRNKKA